MSTRKNVLTIANLRGGRNGAESPLMLPDNQCVEAMNVDLDGGGLGQRRNGSAVIASLDIGVYPVFGMYNYIPAGGDYRDAELWWAAVSTIRRFKGGLTTAFALPDSFGFQYIQFASLAGKLYMAYAGSVDRLHVWDGTVVRRVGVGTPAAAPIVANFGAGTYAPVVRHYKVAYIELAGLDVVRRSELSPVATFTPSGAGTAARVTKPAAVSEGETHWELYGSADNVSYYRVARTLVATTTFDDTTAPSGYKFLPLATDTGENTVSGSPQYIIADGNRLLMAGSWAGVAKRSRVWFTPVIGASDIGDSERVPPDNYVDLNEDDGGRISGFGGPIEGSILVFKRQSLYKMVPTGNAAAPYQVVLVSKTIGAISQESIINAEDQAGRPAIYFLSVRGPYRYGAGGLEYLGAAIEDIWADTWLDAGWHSHGIYYPAKNQLWYWITWGPGAGATIVPSVRVVYDTTLNAWTVHSGASCLAYSSALFARDSGVNGPGLDLAPILGKAGGMSLGDGQIWQADNEGQTTDNGAAYQAYIKTKAYVPAGFGRACGISDPHVVAGVTPSTVTLTVTRNLGEQTRSVTIPLAAQGTETHRQAQAPGLGLANVWAVQFTIGDAVAQAASWVLEAIGCPIRIEEER